MKNYRPIKNIYLTYTEINHFIKHEYDDSERYFIFSRVHEPEYIVGYNIIVLPLLFSSERVYDLRFIFDFEIQKSHWENLIEIYTRLTNKVNNTGAFKDLLFKYLQWYESEFKEVISI